VEHSIVGIIDRVESLETRLPPMDQEKPLEDTCEDDHDKEEEVVDEERFNPPRPPPQWQHCDGQQVQKELPRPPHRPNWQGMGGQPHLWFVWC
jgi:hypothetical protein